MKILFYSTNSNYFDIDTFIITTLPKWNDELSKIKYENNLNDFVIVTQAPGMFLLDKEILFEYKNKKSVKLENVEKSQNVEKSDFFETFINGNKYFLLNIYNSDDFADFIMKQNPDIAIAVSFWVTPYDWLPIKDAIIAEKLRAKGIKTICHPVESTLLCFNKYETHLFLKENNFNTANAVYVNHDLFFSAGSKKEIKDNVYREAIFNQIRKLNYPLLIKDNVGLSSYGMQIINTFGEAKAYFNSKKFNSDRIVEEYIFGQQFGCEIHGCNGHYEILPPFMFSVNQYGITSPKQSVKFGPITDEKYKINDLNKDLLKLANKLKLEGIAQVDLVFTGEKWFIIEINPRFSGMTTTYACSENKNLYKMILESSGLQNKISKNYDFTLNIKFPILDEITLFKLKNTDGVRYICQTEDKAAKQDREMGYCEAIICADTKQNLLQKIEKIQKKFDKIIEKAFFATAEKMIKGGD